MSAMSDRAAVIDQLIADLPAEDLKALAERLASQVGYVLEPEPAHLDCPAQGPAPALSREVIARVTQLRDDLNGSAFVMDAVRGVYSDWEPMGVKLRADLDAILSRLGGAK